MSDPTAPRGSSPQEAGDESFRSPPSPPEPRARCWPRCFLFTEMAGGILILLSLQPSPVGFPQDEGLP